MHQLPRFKLIPERCWLWFISADEYGNLWSIAIFRERGTLNLNWMKCKPLKRFGGQLNGHLRRHLILFGALFFGNLNPRLKLSWSKSWKNRLLQVTRRGGRRNSIPKYFLDIKWLFEILIIILVVIRLAESASAVVWRPGRDLNVRGICKLTIHSWPLAVRENMSIGMKQSH